MFLVMFILPQILYVGDKIVEKTRFNIKVPEVSHSASGTVYVNGRVRGRVSGVVDAHIQGVIYGDVSRDAGDWKLPDQGGSKSR